MSTPTPEGEIFETGALQDEAATEQAVLLVADATNANDADLLVDTEFPPDQFPDPDQGADGGVAK